MRGEEILITRAHDKRRPETSEWKLPNPTVMRCTPHKKHGEWNSLRQILPKPEHDTRIINQNQNITQNECLTQHHFSSPTFRLTVGDYCLRNHHVEQTSSSCSNMLRGHALNKIKDVLWRNTLKADSSVSNVLSILSSRNK